MARLNAMAWTVAYCLCGLVAFVIATSGTDSLEVLDPLLRLFRSCLLLLSDFLTAFVGEGRRPIIFHKAHPNARTEPSTHERPEGSD